MPAPAKLNLFLHVVGRRPDGYHELESVVRFIDRCDWLRFEESDVLELATPQPWPAEHDLALRAASLLRSAADVRKGATIALEKQVPVGGGLGGGSSDAATTLIALNELWEVRWPRAELTKLAVQLGADVPVFVEGRNAFVTGIGERLSAVDLPVRWYFVLVPPLAVATRNVFVDAGLTRNTPRTTIAAFFAGREQRNDLQTVAERQHPELVRYRRWLEDRVDGVRMSGSGSCYFAELEEEGSARALLADLPSDMDAFVARGLAEHPLHPGRCERKPRD